jgi:hypothetical protein
MPVTRKTGYLYQADAYESESYDEKGAVYQGAESWHRTYKGAQRAKAANEDRGAVYRITGDDTSHKVQA